jgi:putative hemolysin
MEEIEKNIDISQAIKNGNSAFLRSMPAFIIRLMEKFICQDEMNAVIHRHRHLQGIPFIKDVLDEWNVKVEVKGRENVPKEGRFVFVANHPVGAIDALSFLTSISDISGPVISPSNELLNYIPNLRPLLLGVNVFGTNTKETVIRLNRLFESDSQVMIFPAGEVSRRTGGVISDIVWQKSFIAKAVEFKRDVIPVFISGRNSGTFYFTSNLRKKIGISMYLETLLLPREMLSQRKKPVTLYFGKPIPWQTFSRERSHSDWAQYVKSVVYTIPQT